MGKWEGTTALLVLSGLAYSAASFGAADPKLKNVKIESAFEDNSGHVVIRFEYSDSDPEFINSNESFFGDSKGLNQLQEAGFSGSTNHFVLDFPDTRLKDNGKFIAGVDEKDLNKETANYTVVCDGKKATYHRMTPDKVSKLQASIRSGNTPLFSLPSNDRSPEYLFKRPGQNQYIYVDASKYNYSYESFRMYVGAPKRMNKRMIADVHRLRDGGTTYIKTKDGETLFSPAAFDPSRKPKWNEFPLERLDPLKFDLASLGIPGVPSPKSTLHTPCDPLLSPNSGAAAAAAAVGNDALKSDPTDSGGSGNGTGGGASGQLQ